MGIEFNSLIRDYADSVKLAKARNEYSGNSKEYPMLRWNEHEQKLEVIMRSETKGMERLLKWIGIGPLSLKKIAHELEKNKGKLDGLRFKELQVDSNTSTPSKEISDQDIEDFANAVLNQFQKYNSHRLLNKVQKSDFSFVNKMHEIATVAGISNTYGDDSNKGNIDFVQANNYLGLAFVADSKGHNKPEKKAELSKHYDGFYSEYMQKLSKQKFQTIDEVEQFISSQVKAFRREMFEVDTPAFSLAQIVADKDGNLSLVTAQTGDTMIVIKRNEEFIYLNTHDHNSDLSISLEVKTTVLEPGDEVLGFSDGIAEFLSRDIFEEVVLANDDRATLLEELKDAIMNENAIEDMDLWEKEGRSVKVHDEITYDDISLFVLDADRVGNQVQLK